MLTFKEGSSPVFLQPSWTLSILVTLRWQMRQEANVSFSRRGIESTQNVRKRACVVRVTVALVEFLNLLLSRLDDLVHG